MIPAILILVIVIASFAPPPIRGIVIILTAGAGVWYSYHTYSPFTKQPELRPSPSEEEGDELVAKHGIAKSLDNTDPLRKVVVETVHGNKKPNFKK